MRVSPRPGAVTVFSGAPSGLRLLLKRRLPVLFFGVISACSFQPEKDRAPSRGKVDASSIPDAVPRVEPKSRYGNMKYYEVLGKRYEVMDSGKGFVQRGIASWYGEKFHGRKTSSGEIYDMYAMTAAHKTLPLPTYLEVKNLENGRKIVVRVNDRGPFHENRIVDLSYTAAIKLDIVRAGTGLVEIRVIDPIAYSRGGAPVYTRSRASKDGALGFYIQVGAFSDFTNAAQLKNKLSPLRQQVRIARARVNGKTVFRVQIGPLNDVDVADDVVNRLGRFGVYAHHIALE